MILYYLMRGKSIVDIQSLRRIVQLLSQLIFVGITRLKLLFEEVAQAR